MAVLSPLSLTPVVVNGEVVVGAKLYVYDAGTDTARTVYQNSALTAQHTQPILTNASGRVPIIFVQGATQYKVRLVTPGGVLIEEIDGITADPASSAPAPSVSGGYETGDFVWSYRTGTRTGFVRANGRTIGGAASGATERANADTQPLFEFLWNNDPLLTVSGGRGATATADFTANKTIALPDLRFRMPIGLDDMGAAAAGRSVGATFATGSATTLGSVGGAAGETLTTTQIPSHTHTGTTSTSADHQHSGTTAAAGGLTPSGSISSESAGTPSGSISSVSAGTPAGTLSSDGAHSHTIAFLSALTNGGSVNATMLVGTGNTVTTSSDGVHTHSFSGTAMAAHTHAFTGSAMGTHNHSFVGTAVPDHSHTFVSSAAGAHSHTFTSAATGGGAAHNNMAPFIVGTWYVHL